MDMKDLLIIAASMRSKDEIIEALEEAINNHKLGIKADTEHEIALHCQMFLVHTMTNGDLDKAMKLTKEMEEQKKRSDMFKPGQS